MVVDTTSLREFCELDELARAWGFRSCKAEETLDEYAQALNKHVWEQVQCEHKQVA